MHQKKFTRHKFFRVLLPVWAQALRLQWIMLAVALSSYSVGTWTAGH